MTFRAGPFETSADALKWIGDNGLDGHSYRGVRIPVASVTVTVKKVEKRVLS